MIVEKPHPLSPAEELVVRLVSFIIGVNIWLGLWLIFSLPPSYSLIGAFAGYAAVHMISARYMGSPATSRLGESREWFLRRRISELRTELAELESKKTYRG